MIDLHCHLLWDVDDGCPTREDSLEMASEMVDHGVTAVGVTPHLRHDFDWVNTRDKVHARVEELRAALAEHAIPLEVHPGCEHYLTPELMEHISRSEHTLYADGPYMLVEVPYGGAPPDLAGVLFRIRCQKISLLLAHVERYERVGVDLKILRLLHQQGVYLQVNLGSLTGAYGREAERQAFKVLDAGLVHVVAGDCHSAEDVRLLVDEGLERLRRHVGPSVVRLLMEHNPCAVLQGKPLEDMPT